MKTLTWCAAVAAVGFGGLVWSADGTTAKVAPETVSVKKEVTATKPAKPKISGDYLEARTCDVYTGPCFANGEIGLTGREAVLAWKVDEGNWEGEDLKGMVAGLVLKAKDTLSQGGSFQSAPDPIKSVILVDSKATSAQQAALVKFVKDAAPHLTKEVVKVEVLAMNFDNDHVNGVGKFSAGEMAKIETRKMRKGDCVCSNESVFYPPLTEVSNSQAAFTRNMTFGGDSLNSTWSTINKRSAFLATFER